MKNALFFLAAILLLTVSCTDNQIQLNGDEPEPTPPAERVEPPLKRALWASINGRKDASYYPEYNNKILVSWRMFPTDDSSTSMSRRRRSKAGKMALATRTRATSNGLPSTSR